MLDYHLVPGILQKLSSLQETAKYDKARPDSCILLSPHMKFPKVSGVNWIINLS